MGSTLYIVILWVLIVTVSLVILSRGTATTILWVLIVTGRNLAPGLAPSPSLGRVRGVCKLGRGAVSEANSVKYRHLLDI